MDLHAARRGVRGRPVAGPRALGPARARGAAAPWTGGAIVDDDGDDSGRGQCVLAGLRASVAQTLALLALDLRDVRVFQTLSGALADCIER